MIAFIYFFGYIVSWYLIAGLKYSYFVNYYPTLDTPSKRKENLGFAMTMATLGSIIWPIILPVAWMASGFGHYGIWSVPPTARRKDREKDW